ncbi:hypothetical protein CROQUDRAFT_131982 [Cronartium quercuum f. sp. fusiforme G11]|uniref:Secreted protein n=1 Tax=Cronartium quercuum f. sp. fusiforme G11 TaxID=708437 RepID=A0A9P6NQB3_9BASI|nr:hypothetical protein CROQUDRAFT_131982 [Cronartium quercuum f. sp. fusiforme G11]
MRSGVFLLVVLALFQTIIGAPFLTRRAEQQVASSTSLKNIQMKCAYSGVTPGFLAYTLASNGFNSNPCGAVLDSYWNSQVFSYYSSISTSYYSNFFGTNSCTTSCISDMSGLYSLMNDLRLQQDQNLKEAKDIKTSDQTTA